MPSILNTKVGPKEVWLRQVSLNIITIMNFEKITINFWGTHTNFVSQPYLINSPSLNKYYTQ